MKRTRHIILSAAGLLVCGLMLGFSIDRSKDMRCTGFEVEVEGDGLIRFHHAEGIREVVQEHEGVLLGKALKEIDLYGIESHLESLPHIAEAKVYRSIKGAVHVEVEQKRPLFRFLDADGDRGYIDNEGGRLPLSKDYVHACIPVTGHLLWEETDEEMTQGAAVSQVYELMRYVDAQEFWKAQILQIDVGQQGELTIIPRVGNHEILFGTAENYEEKFKKLKTFYEKGITQTNWNLYRRLDIRYAGQVVCTKR